MADAIGNKAAKDYHLDIPAADQGFFAKGLGNTDWGFKNRIARMFNPESSPVFYSFCIYGNVF